MAQHIRLPYNCMHGVCHVCAVKATRGSAPAASQLGLAVNLKKQGVLLTCQCFPSEDMDIEDIESEPNFSASILDKTWLNQDVLRLRLNKPDNFTYQPGQYINILQYDTGLSRSYSLASLASEDFLELHIKRFHQGKMSTWLCDVLPQGHTINFSASQGECFYQPNNPQQDLILAGISTGLSPLYGILREALKNNHQGNIYVFHASLEKQGLYYQNELSQIAKAAAHVRYIPCVLKGEVPQDGQQGAIDQLIVATLGNCTGKRAYLCGDDAIVQTMKKTLFFNGVAQKDIFADAFVSAA